MKTDFESAKLDSSIRKRTDAFTRHWLRSFSSLRNRNYRWLWTGTLFSINGMQMQIVAGGWLVYTMTNSPLALGMVAAGSGLPILLFSLFGGVLADRVQKRNLILVTQLSVFFISFIITILIATDLIALWHIVVASFFGGVIFLILFGLSRSMFPAVIWLLFIGCGGSIFFALINTLMMSNTPLHLIGRVTSIFIWTFGLMPLGMLPAGAFAEAFGAPYTVVIGGGILTLFLFGVVVARPGMRRLK